MLQVQCSAVVSFKEIHTRLDCREPGCASPVPPGCRTYSYQGALLKVKLECLAGHCSQWHSSSVYSKGDTRGRARSRLNLQLCHFTLTCGLTYSKTQVGGGCLVPSA